MLSNRKNVGAAVLILQGKIPLVALLNRIFLACGAYFAWQYPISSTLDVHKIHLRRSKPAAGEFFWKYNML